MKQQTITARKRKNQFYCCISALCGGKKGLCSRQKYLWTRQKYRGDSMCCRRDDFFCAQSRSDFHRCAVLRRCGIGSGRCLGRFGPCSRVQSVYTISSIPSAPSCHASTPSAPHRCCARRHVKCRPSNRRDEMTSSQHVSHKTCAGCTASRGGATVHSAHRAERRSIVSRDVWRHSRCNGGVG